MNCMPFATQRDRRGLLALLLLTFLLAPSPAGWTQYPGAPPLAGSTLGQSLRNSAAATQNQLTALRNAADNWYRRATSANYGDAELRQDYDNVLWQFQSLRAQFNYLAQLALQLGRPRADNAVAELDAGLNIIAELFTFLQEQYAAGTLDRATVQRTARLFQKAIREWELELRKNTSRLGIVW